jgi:hypothetical protein
MNGVVNNLGKSTPRRFLKGDFLQQCGWELEFPRWGRAASDSPHSLLVVASSGGFQRLIAFSGIHQQGLRELLPNCSHGSWIFLPMVRRMPTPPRWLQNG